MPDTFIYNLGVVSIGLGVGSMLYYGPAFYPQGNLVWGCDHRRHRDGDDLLRLHHLDHYPAALRRHLCVRIAHPAAGARAHHEPGRDHGLAVLLRHRRLLDRHPCLGADVCRSQPAHRQRDLPHHLEDDARAVGDVPDRRGDPAAVPGRAVLRDALLSHPQQVGVHSRHGEHGVPHRGACHVDARAVRGQSQRAGRPLARRARRLQRDHRQRQGEGLGRSRLRSLADDVDVQLAVPAVDRRGLLHRHRRRNQIRRQDRRPWVCWARCSSPRWRS